MYSVTVRMTGTLEKTLKIRPDTKVLTNRNKLVWGLVFFLILAKLRLNFPIPAFFPSKWENDPGKSWAYLLQVS